MGRWGPDARRRLEQAALALYLERGFEQTTVAEIAARAGLTERTFFRHFADKREVLFGGAGQLQETVVNAVEGAPAQQAPLQSVAAALERAGATFGAHADYSRQRQRVIDATPELQARELSKLSGLASAIAHALRRRGLQGPDATLTAEAAVLVFRVAFERWVRGEEDWSMLFQDSLTRLGAVLQGPREKQGS